MTHQVHTKIQINLVEWSTHFARAILHPFYGDNRHYGAKKLGRQLNNLQFHGENNEISFLSFCTFCIDLSKRKISVKSIEKNLILQQKCNSHQPRKWQQQQQLQWMKRKFVDLLFRFKYEHITVTVDAKWQKCEKQNSKHKNGFLLG